MIFLPCVRGGGGGEVVLNSPLFYVVFAGALAGVQEPAGGQRGGQVRDDQRGG